MNMKMKKLESMQGKLFVNKGIKSAYILGGRPVCTTTKTGGGADYIDDDLTVPFKMK